MLTVGGACGVVASAVLVVEKMRLLADPTYRPSCSINPILSCESVMTTPQAEIFGFPNPVLGLVAFPVVAALGAAVLTGIQLNRLFWLGLQAGGLGGVAFVHWLIVQSLYRIGALCPYCMVVWVATIAIFWSVTVHNLRTGQLRPPRSLAPVARLALAGHTFVLLLWYLTIVVLIGVRFWSFWRTLLD
ncbi:vitamin K epoxide reductase family protein [Asanoa sp. WMMD1127]|uniref:vitamin K epoxide reductase family protein n=1 Tax=Asanoa sp. WMMD1127 TaxID=3016107 RepID=UPI0024162172|nr:vitamin K epoxide reductase family protein [Asanoa sp. WMMD1127]MDG4825080.1 vitamin K epoxide reductase family protein [Asanoa sp. WMMD1127]